MKQQLVEGEDFYYNEDGYIVLTENIIWRKDFVAAMAASIVLMIMKMFLNRSEAI